MFGECHIKDNYCECWVLVKFRRAQTHRDARYDLRWCIGHSPLDRGLSCYNTESLTMVYNVFWECNAPCTLKTSFVISKKIRIIVAITKD